MLFASASSYLYFLDSNTFGSTAEKKERIYWYIYSMLPRTCKILDTASHLYPARAIVDELIADNNDSKVGSVFQFHVFLFFSLHISQF